MQLGCDPDDLDRLVPRCSELAADLRSVRARVARLDRRSWTGPGAVACWRFLQSQLIPLLAFAASLLDELGRTLRRQADEQRRASLRPAVTIAQRVSTVGDGRWVGRTGTADARTVVVLVPGVGTTIADRGALREDAQRVWAELAIMAQRSGARGGAAVPVAVGWPLTPLPIGTAAVDPTDSVAVVSWLGYDPPDDVLAGIDRGAAHAGAMGLATEVHRLRAEGADRIIVVGHSYGGLVSARAASRGMAADEVVLLGAPGLGAGLSEVADLHLSPGADLWTATERNDPVAWIGRLGLVHGPDPASLARHLPTSGSGHSSYLEDPELLGALAMLAIDDAPP